MRLLPNPQAIRAVFLDVGYTLLAPHPSTAAIVAAVCARRHLDVGMDCLRGSLPAAEATFRASAQADLALWTDERAIQAMWTAYFQTLLDACLTSVAPAEKQACLEEVVRVYDGASSYALYPDVLPFLETLKAHDVTLGVISDWGIGLGLILRHHDLVRFFDFAVVSAAVRLAKPDPELYRTALARADAIPDYAAHIGDSYVLDVLGARAAGITPILLDRAKKHDPDSLDCLVVPDLLSVLDLLEITRPAVHPL